MAAALGLSSVFNPKLPSITSGPAKSKRVIANNRYKLPPGISRTQRRDITPLTEMKNRKHMPHQGKQECARRLKQMKRLEEKRLLAEVKEAA